MKIKNPKLVEVEWVDIFATSGWEKLEEVNPPHLHTYGYLVLKSLPLGMNMVNGLQLMHFLEGVLKKYAPFRGR